MNGKKFTAILVLVLAVLVANTAMVFAHPAEAPDTPIYRPFITPCAGTVLNAEEQFARIDIPSSRADYQTLDRLAGCLKVAGVNTVPVTGSGVDLQRQRYEEFKILQAERMSE